MAWNSGATTTFVKLATRTLSAACPWPASGVAHSKAATIVAARPHNIEAINSSPIAVLSVERPPKQGTGALPGALRLRGEDLCADSYLGMNREPWFIFLVKHR